MEQETLDYLATHHAQLDITRLLNEPERGPVWNGAFGWERINHGAMAFDIKFKIPNTDPAETYSVRAERDHGNFELTSDLDLRLPLDKMQDVLRNKAPNGIWWRPWGSNGVRFMSRTLYPVCPDVQIREMVGLAYRVKREERRRIEARLSAEQPATQGR
jgi:hypothetical protein